MVNYGTGGSGKIVLLDSGNFPSFSNFLNQTWLWNGANGNGDWTNLSSSLVNATPLGPSVGTPPVVMSGRINQVMALDSVSGNVLMYGGQGASETAGVFQDTWLFNTSTLVWSLQTPTVTPFARYNAEAATVGGTGLVMFGGQNNNSILLETWVWNGTNWSQVTVANGSSPNARVNHCFVGNTAGTGTALLFGGKGINQQFNDTWTYTTSAGWVKQTPTTSPSVRSNACMSYDSVNSVWVLFGGQNEYGFLNDTWTYSLVGGWAQVNVAAGTGPAGRIAAQMAFDTVTGTTIMFGGISATDNYPSGATWSFNAGTGAWRLL